MRVLLVVLSELQRHVVVGADLDAELAASRTGSLLDGDIVTRLDGNWSINHGMTFWLSVPGGVCGNWRIQPEVVEIAFALNIVFVVLLGEPVLWQEKVERASLSLVLCWDIKVKDGTNVRVDLSIQRVSHGVVWSGLVHGNDEARLLISSLDVTWTLVCTVVVVHKRVIRLRRLRKLSWLGWLRRLWWSRRLRWLRWP